MRSIYILICWSILFLHLISTAWGAKQVIFGITPWESPNILNRMHKPLMKHLEKQLGIKAIFIVAKDYKDLERLMRRKKVDIGLFPPVAYVNAKEKLPKLKYLLTVTANNPETGEVRSHYKGVIINLNSSDTQTLEGLRGKRFGFTDLNSSSGYKYPIQLFKNRGIEPNEYFSQVFMLKKHPKVTQALVKGVIDGGATWDHHLSKAIKEHGDIFRILASVPIPYDAWATWHPLSNPFIRNIKTELLKLKPEGHVLLEMKKHGYPYSGWEERNDQFYNPVRTVAGLKTTKSKNNRIVFGVTPWIDAKKLRKMFSPLMSYLSQTLGRKFVFRVANTYDDLGKRIKNKAVDVGLFPPRAYVYAKSLIPQLKYLVTYQRIDSRGELRDYYKGVIITLKSSSFKSLDSLKGTRFAFTDYHSASGYLYPSALLKKKGIIPDTYFSQVFMLKKHDKVTAALVHHSIDAGATWDQNLKNAIKKYGKVFRTIAETEPIPLDAYAAGPHVSDQDCEIIKTALLQLKSDSIYFQKMKQLGFPFDGYTIRSDEFYNVVREMSVK